MRVDGSAVQDAYPGRSVILEGEGQLSVAWLVDDELVVRVPKHAFGIERLQFEVRLLASIAARFDAIAAVPRIIDARVELPVGRAYVAHQRIPGNVLRQPDVATLSTKRIEVIGTQVGQFLRELHAIDFAALTAVPVRTPAQFAAHLGVEVDSLLRPRIAPDELEALHTALRELATLPPSPVVLAHTDIGGNIVVDDDGRVGIIDFGSCFATHPALDVASLAVLGAHLVEAAAAEYPLLGDLQVESEVVARTFFLQDALYGARQEEWQYVDAMFARGLVSLSDTPLIWREATAPKPSVWRDLRKLRAAKTSCARSSGAGS